MNNKERLENIIVVYIQNNSTYSFTVLFFVQYPSSIKKKTSFQEPKLMNKFRKPILYFIKFFIDEISRRLKVFSLLNIKKY
jgi:hypothetical protein